MSNSVPKKNDETKHEGHEGHEGQTGQAPLTHRAAVYPYPKKDYPENWSFAHSPIHIFSVANSYDQYPKVFVRNLVDDPVVADSQAMQVVMSRQDS